MNELMQVFHTVTREFLGERIADQIDYQEHMQIVDMSDPIVHLVRVKETKLRVMVPCEICNGSCNNLVTIIAMTKHRGEIKRVYFMCKKCFRSPVLLGTSSKAIFRMLASFRRWK